VTAGSLAVAARAVAAVAAAVLVATGSGSATVAAVLLGLALADRRAGAAGVLAVLATGIRFRTDGFGDLAGIQSVLGDAGRVGPPNAAASAWLAAIAVLLAAAALRADAPRWLAVVAAVPTGLLAAALVAGPGPDQLGRRAVASAIAVVLAAGVALLARAVAADPDPVRGGWDVWDDVEDGEPAGPDAPVEAWSGWGVASATATEAPARTRTGRSGVRRRVVAAVPWLAVACAVAAGVLAGWPS